MMLFIWLTAVILGVGAIVWDAETFAKHLSTAAGQLNLSPFALALLLAGAEPE
jgi:cation:H+ antiporter